MIIVKNLVGEILESFVDYQSAYSMFPNYKQEISLGIDGEPLEEPQVNDVLFIPKNAEQSSFLVGLEDFPKTDLETSKLWAFNRVKQQHASAIKHLTGDTTEEERDTWYDQRAAAKAFLSDTASDDQVAMLDALLIPGETKTDLSTAIMGKNKLMLLLIGKAGGIKRRTEHALSLAGTVEEISTAMDTAAAESATAVEEYKAAVQALASQAQSAT